MEYMTVTARMHEPIIHYEDGMHLDGILSFGAFLQYVKDGGPPLPPMNLPWVRDFDLPLAKWTRPLPDGAEVDQRLLDDQGQVWGWWASCVDANWIKRGKMEYRKRPATDMMRRYTEAKTHHLGAGPLKAFDVAYPTLFAHQLRWVCRGDIEAVRRLLQLVTHLGKKSTTGMGAVAKWVVESCEQQSIDRRMPHAGGMQASIRPPYHHVSRRLPAGWEMI